MPVDRCTGWEWAVLGAKEPRILTRQRQVGQMTTFCRAYGCTFLSATLMTLVIVSGCSAGLDRSKAASMIQKHTFFQYTTNIDLNEPPGTRCEVVPDSETMNGLTGFLEKRHPNLRPFIAAGLISANEQYVGMTTRLGTKTGCSQVYGRQSLAERLSTDYLQLTVTYLPKGVAAGLHTGPIPYYARRFVEVSGITDNPDGTKTAEFTWDWVGQPDALKLGLVSPKLARHGVALFRKYDDGWRLMSVGSPSSNEFR